MILLPLFAGTHAWGSALFEGDSVLEVELIGQIHALITDREERREYRLRIRHAGAEAAVMVRVRGKSRAGLCEFPPLRLDFAGAETAGSAFVGQGGVKLVTHCLNSEVGELNLLEEYLAYRIFNLVTDVSYRVRLLRMTYTDVDGLREPEATSHFGFVIEPAGQLARRLGGTEARLPEMAPAGFDQDHLARVYVFQYLVGNTDWSFVAAEGERNCCHNGDLFEAGGELFYVPFDFDLSGIVNAFYARPDPALRLRSVRNRRYRGLCTEPEILVRAIRHVKALEVDVGDLVKATPGFTAKQAQGVLDYLGQFFDRAEKETKMLKSFGRQCLSQ